MIRLQGTFILLSSFNLLLTHLTDLSWIPFMSTFWGSTRVFWAWGHTAHAGSDTWFPPRAPAADGARLIYEFLVVSTAENRTGANAGISTLWCTGKQCWEGTLELLFGIFSALSQLQSSLGTPQLLPVPAAGTRHHLQWWAQPVPGLAQMSQQGHLCQHGAEDRPPVACPCATRSLCWEGPSPQGAEREIPAFVRQRHKQQKGQIISQ